MNKEEDCTAAEGYVEEGFEWREEVDGRAQKRTRRWLSNMRVGRARAARSRNNPSRKSGSLPSQPVNCHQFARSATCTAYVFIVVNSNALTSCGVLFTRSKCQLPPLIVGLACHLSDALGPFHPDSRHHYGSAVIAGLRSFVVALGPLPGRAGIVWSGSCLSTLPTMTHCQ